MNIDELMTRSVEACRADDSLSRAAQIMWERDCGCVPVVDGDRHLLGILTDRDICMAAYIKGRPIHDIAAHEVMSREVRVCAPGDTFEAVQTMMQVNQIRRVPVLDADGALVGIVSLNDLAREAERQRNPKLKELHIRQVEATLAAVCRPRPTQISAAVV